jgi:hypothetical protein
MAIALLGCCLTCKFLLAAQCDKTHTHTRIYITTFVVTAMCVLSNTRSDVTVDTLTQDILLRVCQSSL